MKISKLNGVFIAESKFQEKDYLKEAGFWWHPRTGACTRNGCPLCPSGLEQVWWTADVNKAARLVTYADEDCKTEIEAALHELDELREASRATDADIDIPCPDGLAYLPYQRGGIAFATKRNSVLIADEMGLGKTIQAIGVINLDTTINTVLVVCPASLKLNWKREMEKWFTRDLSVGVAQSGSFPATNVVIINYDILKRHQEIIADSQFDMLIVDEAHYVKNDKAIRSQMVKAINARRRVFLTGTPIVNRPKELFPIISQLDPVTFGKFWPYAKRYCGAVQSEYGWDLNGATNLDELQDKLRTSIMVRRLKKDVLTELPPKTRQVIEFEGGEDVVAKERSAYAKHQDRIQRLQDAVELAKASDDASEYKLAVDALREGQGAVFSEISKLRHDTAVAKIPFVIDFIRDQITEGDHKVIVFVHHKDVAKALKEAFGSAAVVVTGDVAMQKRQDAVDAFQNDPTVTVFIGNIQAAGVGLTLTASSHVIFAELDWVPGNISQAEDRAHRIGQRSNVLVQHLVLQDSLDATMAKTLIAKQEVIDKALDNEYATEPIVVPVFEDRPKLTPKEKKEFQKFTPTPVDYIERATARISRERVEKEAETMKTEQVAAIHEGLRTLDMMCDGAYQKDGSGFNKADSFLGKSLARLPHLTRKQAVLGKVLVNRYRGQLDPDLVAVTKGELIEA